MSNTGQNAGQKSGQGDEPHEDALAALHGLESESHELEEGHEEEHHEKAEVRDDNPASSAASGFVGMLAKEGAGDSGGSAAPIPMAPSRSRPEEIKMARELPADSLMAAGGGRSGLVTPRAPGRKPVKQVPGWYHAAIPVMFTMGSLLLLIGLWAVGAVIYMAVKTPQSPSEVGYPLLEWVHNPDGDGGGYSQWSKLVAIGMVVCVPLALAMFYMGRIMAKQVGVADRAAGKQA